MSVFDTNFVIRRLRARLPDYYPDISAYSFGFQVDHEADRFRVSGIMRNASDVAITTPFVVAIGVTILLESGITWSQQENFLMTPPTGGFPPGASIETPFSGAPLVYADNNPNHKYTIEMIADLESDVSELRSDNNYLGLTWWVLSSDASARLRSAGRMKIESSNGQVSSVEFG